MKSGKVTRGGRGRWGRKRLYLAGHGIALLLIAVGLAIPSQPPPRGSSRAAFLPDPEDPATEWRVARHLPLTRFSPASPSGLAWNPVGDTLVTLDAADGVRSRRLLEISREADPIADTALEEGQIDPRTLLFDGESGRLAALGRDGLTTHGLDAWHRIAPDREVTPIRKGLLRSARGMAIDPDRGTVFLIDGIRPRLVRLDPLSPDHSLEGVLRSGAMSAVNLRGTDLEGAIGLTFNTQDGLLYTIDEVAVLHAVSPAGDRIASWDLAALGITDPRGLVAAPSADGTDDPAIRSLYILDAGRGPHGAIAEIERVATAGPDAIAQGPVAQNLVNETATLVRRTHTSQYSPPSPDPAGIAYLGNVGRLLVSDSEVNEMSIFQGKNLFEVRLAGSLFASTNTLAFSSEPTGLAWNPVNGRLFVSDDDARRIFELRPGSDGRFGTSDDTVTSFDTRPFGNTDPEGVAFDHVLGHLYIIDGVNREVFKVRPGPNGNFDGVDDIISQFDIGTHGLTDPEGIAYNAVAGTLFLADKGTKKIYETSLSGTLLRIIDISAASPSSPAGVEYAPSSGNPAFMSLWVVDRGTDNDSDPSENDGRLYELSLPGDVPVPNQPPNVDAGPAQVVTLAGGAMLDGTVSDDGLPNPPGAVDTTWSKVSGPGNVTFGNASAVDTTANFSAVGAYVLRLSGYDGSLTTTDDVGIEVVDAAGDFIFDRAVAASSDDAEQAVSDGDMKLSSSDLEIVVDGGTQQVVGIRFTNVTIPRGAFIVRAYVQFTVDEDDADPMNVLIEGHNVNNAPTFNSTSFNISSRARTTASVPWSPVPWNVVGAAGEAQRTPNIASIIGEIVNRPLWVSGNALALIFSGSGERTAESFDGSASDAPRLHVEYNTGAPPPNTPPAVSAGPDQTITLPAAASLDGTVSDDGFPVPPGFTTTTWSKVSGPGGVTFGDASAVDTTATFTVEGAYVLQLQADDGDEIRTDTVAITVNPAPQANTPPVVSAGADQSILFPNSANLIGSVDDDGLIQPWSGGWSKVSGPGTVSFFDPGAVSTTASFGVPGAYVLRLTAFDGEYTRSDDIGITVTAVGGTVIPLERRIITSSDDAEESDSGSMSLTSSDLEFVQDGSKHQTVGLRFTNISIPRNATILDAWVRFTVDEDTTDPTSLLIEGQASDSPTAFSGADFNISSRPRTFASVPWAPPVWPTVGASGADQTAEGLGPILQELVSREGWSSGNAVVLIITGTGERVAESFEGESSAAALLHIEYDPEPVGNLPPQVTAMAPATVILPSAASLDGTVFDEGLPDPPGVVTTTWSKVSGPGNVSFTDEFAVDTDATFSAAGVYQLMLEADDGEFTASATVSITVLEAGSSQAVDIRVSSSIDDVEEKASGSINTTSSDLELVYDGGNQTVGMRFTNVTVPQGATIVSAWIQFTSDEIQNGTVNLTLQAQASDNAPPFTTASLNVSSRARTGAQVAWSPPGWNAIGEAGPAQKTEDLRAVIQEVVSRPLWASGNAIVVIVTGSGERIAKSYDGNPSQAALLHIEYQN